MQTRQGSDGSGTAEGERLLVQALDCMPYGFSVWNWDQRLIHFNRQYLELYGFAPESIWIGMTLREMTEATCAAGNYPGFSVEEVYVTFAQRLRAAQDQSRLMRAQRTIHGRRIKTTNIGLPGIGWVVTHEDVTDDVEAAARDRERDAAAKQQNARFAAAVNSMPNGLSMYDRDWKLVVCNQRYLDVYGLSADLALPGTPFKDIIAQRRAAGAVPIDVDGDFADHVLRTSDPTKRDVQTYRLKNGRVVRVTQEAIGEFGYLAMHQDITADMQQIDALNASRAQLELQNVRFASILNNIDEGLCMFDGEQRLLACNDVYVSLYELPPELSVRGVLHADIVAYRIRNGLKSLGDAEPFLDRHQKFLANPRPGDVKVQLRDGRIISIRHRPMPDGGWVSTHVDVTKELDHIATLEASREEAALQRYRLDAAVNTMDEGLCMFDEHQTLVISNEGYARIYRLPPELSQPGTAHRAIVEYREASGMSPVAGVESFMSQHWQLQSDEVSRKVTVELADGRLITIHHHPMPGGGWVSTHLDVTEDHRRVLALEEREQALGLQNMRFDAAVNNISQGLCMFDRAERLVVGNAAYAAIYDLPPELMVPGTPLARILDHRSENATTVAAAGASTYARDLRTMVANNTFVRDVIELADGRAIAIRFHPLADGGWVATHEDITEQRRNEARIRHMARHDALTDLPNRIYLREEMERAERSLKRGESFAVLCVDLDHFKAVNDVQGHATGDAVLRTVADRLRAAARETDLVARLGGDEFAVLVRPITGPDDAAALAGRIVASIAEPMQFDGPQALIGTSVGIALAPTDGITTDALLQNADLALYRAKSEGRGNYHFFQKGMDEALQKRRALEQGLRMGLARNEFRLVFQPLVNLAENRISCLEALLRWDHAERGTISPAEFIPIAEETGAIVQIGEWVLREACKAAALWPDNIHIAVNLSVVQFKNRGLVEQVKSALAEAGLDAHRLELEITESLLLADTAATIETLHQLRDLGVAIAMDDFGTGYSSLSYLRAFPFDKIKIDRSFMQESVPSAGAVTIVKAVIGLGRSLGMATTAEGIETEEQLETVREQGCSEVQGYLFSPPLPAAGIAELLQAWSTTGTPATRRASSARGAKRS